MGIPSYQDFMFPLLQTLSNGEEQRISDLQDQIADQLRITEAEREELLPSGGASVFSNRLAWAKTYLKRAGLLHNERRGYVRISARGKEALDAAPGYIDRSFLLQFPEFSAFVAGNDKPGNEGAIDLRQMERSPTETMELAFDEYRRALADDLLEQILGATPRFFEQVVIDLLVAMGYGGSRADAGEAIGKTGDGGIDGIIKEDRLGLDLICVQAKRWQASVGRPLVQAFAGSMEAHRARKGVILTTSDFTRDAYDYVERIERKIILIGGRRLTELMIEYGVGVAVARTYPVKRIDTDYFVGDVAG